MTRRVWSPRPMALGGPDPAGLIEQEAYAIVAVLHREGPLTTRTLKRHVESRFWGPGRFGPALRRAALDGRVRRLNRQTWAATDRA